MSAFGQKAAGVLAVSLPLSLTIFTYVREIVPLYGLRPTTLLLEAVVFAAILFSSVQPFPIRRKTNLILAAVAFSLAPNATYWIAAWTARRKDPVWGPAITHASVLAPLTVFLTSFVVEMDDPDAKSRSSPRPSAVLRILRGIMTFFTSILLFQRVWYPSSFFHKVSGNQIFLFLAAIFYSLWIFSLSIGNKKVADTGSKNKKKSKNKASSVSDVQLKAALVIGFLAFWHQILPLLGNPVLPHPLQRIYTHPQNSLRILSAEQSVTGLIIVAEWLRPTTYQGEDNQMDSVRYLRASHSLLGGVWLQEKVETLDNAQPVRDSQDNPLGDSIYATFVLQEAGLLVNSTKAAEEHPWMNALVIGLGTGISANAFIRHKISTTIVEIDPAVYNAARKWFGLADPGVGRVFLEDARSWAAEKHANIKAGKDEILYDIVVHDCFSGGGVPKHLFTVEFWDDLMVLMAPEAVLVVNIAGMINSESSRFVINTLENKFGRCRAFHDHFEPINVEYDTKFINMVMFCSRSSAPLTFRSAVPSDWLGSPLRRYVFQTLESREIDLDVIRATADDEKYILTDENNALGTLQNKEGNSHHFTVMREVLPAFHWETY